MKPPKIAIGVDSFQSIKETGCYFIDKSNLIYDFLNSGAETQLIVRPRRFGKTTNIRMLECFLDYRMQTDHLFSGLKITDHKDLCKKYLNKCPVIAFSFKATSGFLTWPECKQLICRTIKNIYEEHIYLLESHSCSVRQKEAFQKIIKQTANDADWQCALKDLSHMLSLHTGKKVYILIDEYDAAIHSSYKYGYYDQCISFMRTIYGEAYKGNDYLAKGMLTGILRVSHESLFSGVNNISVHTVLSDTFAKYFGVLEEELLQMLKIYNLESHFENLKLWYNGYHFGCQESIYNPWSILNWLQSPEKKFESYWVNSSINDVLKTMFGKKPIELKPEIMKLFLRETITTELDLNTSFKDELTERPELFWGFIVQTGYLTVKDVLTRADQSLYYTLRVPNNEMLVVFKKMINDWLIQITQQTEPYLANDAKQSILNGDMNAFQIILQKLLLQVTSYHDFANSSESTYHAFMTGFMVWLGGQYSIKSNREAGHGRYDLCLTPVEKQYPAYIFEFKLLDMPVHKKTAPSMTFVTRSLNAALTQIDDKQYEQELANSQYTKFFRVAVVFYKKHVWLKAK